MRNRVAAVVPSLLLLLLAAHAYAQLPKWETVSYEKWGFTLQIPTGSQKHALPDQPQDATYDIYAARGLACVVKVAPTPDDQLASTAIEQAIQAEVKESSKLSPARRWEQSSKHGDLFKGFMVVIQLNKVSAADSAISKIVGADTAFECVSMAPLGDETSPILRVGVIGPKSRQAEVIATAKGLAAFVSKIGSEPSAPPPVTVPAPKKLVPEPRPSPKPNPKPWPELRRGEIELTGVVDVVSSDRKSMSMIVDTVQLPGQDPITLTPVRPKKVLLRQRLNWLAAGQRIRILGKNNGEGKPMTADAVEQLPAGGPPTALPSLNTQP